MMRPSTSSSDQGPPPHGTINNRRRALILVDLSVEQMSAVARPRADAVVANCLRLVQQQLPADDDTASSGNARKSNSATSSTLLFDLGIDCRLWLKSPQESSLSKVWPETGKTMFVADSEGASLLPELHSIIRSKSCLAWTFVPKNNYSCFANTRLRDILQEENISTVYIAGINTDYCIFATALDAFQYHYETFVIRDAVTSVRGANAHEEGLRNLTRHFGDTVLVTTEEVLSLATAEMAHND